MLNRTPVARLLRYRDGELRHRDWKYRYHRIHLWLSLSATAREAEASVPEIADFIGGMVRVDVIDCAEDPSCDPCGILRISPR
jgi:hypothetical protein